MSGGAFDYDQYKIGQIADIIEDYIYHNNSEEIDEYGYKKHRSYSDETIDQFKIAVCVLRCAQIYAHRIDWLLSDDDGEETFHKRLVSDLEKQMEETLLL